MINPNELEVVWALVGKVGAGIALIVALIKGAQFLFSLTPTSRLEIRVKKCEENLDKDYKRLERVDADILEIKKVQNGNQEDLKKLSKGINKIGTSQITLLRHMIDGNGIEEMKAEADDLTKFFIEQ